MTPEEFDRSFLWRYRAKVISVHDGDTCTLLADCGFHGRHEVNVRIADLNAPELNASGGQDAKQRLERAIGWHGDGWPLRVATRQRDTVVSETMSFARYVADIYLMDTAGNLVNLREVL